MLAAIGGLAVAAGALLIVPVPPGRWRFPPVRSGLSAAVAVLLVAAIATPLVLTAPDWPVTGSTASATVTPPPIPASVTQVDWSTEVDGRVKEVVAGGTGAVVLFEDGVAGLDGITGEIRWSRRRAGSEAKSVNASPDGRTVLVQLNPYDQDESQWEALDAVTGEVRFSQSGLGLVFSGTPVWLTNTSFIRTNLKRTTFTASSLTDGSELWTYSAPDDCRIVNKSGQFLAYGSGFLLALGCGREVRYVSLDGTTGKVRWQHDWRVSEPPQYTSEDVRVDRAEDGRLVQVYVPAAAEGTQFTVFDTETGTVLPAPPRLTLRTSGIGVVDPPDGPKVGGPDDRKLWDVRANHAVGTESEGVLRCALADETLLAGGVVCPDSSVTPYVKDGTVKLSIVRFGETTVRPVTVSLGGPFGVQERGRSADPFVSRAVFGAVVGYTAYQPAAGHRSRIVGLR